MPSKCPAIGDCSLSFGTAMFTCWTTTITTDGEITTSMYNPSHPGRIIRQRLIEDEDGHKIERVATVTERLGCQPQHPEPCHQRQRFRDAADGFGTGTDRRRQRRILALHAGQLRSVPASSQPGRGLITARIQLRGGQSVTESSNRVKSSFITFRVLSSSASSPNRCHAASISGL